MVVRKRTYRRRPRTYRRRVRRYYKRHVPRKLINKQFVKLRKNYSMTLGTVPTGGNSLIHTILCDDPTNPIVTPINMGSFTEWDSCVQLYDYYRVCAVKIKSYPISNTSEITDLTATSQYYAPVFVVHDVNSTTLATQTINIDNFLQYGNCKVFNQYRPFKYYRKMWKTIQTAGATNDPKGYKPTSQPFASQCLAVLYSGHYTQSDMELCRIVVTFYVHLKSRN